VAALQVGKRDEERGQAIDRFVDTAQAIIMQLVRMIMAFTPYGILALMTKVVAGSNAADVLNLLSFVVASYVAIAIMFGVHGLLLLLNGVDLREYARHVWPVLTFAFTSRSSAATIPLNVETQVDKLKVPTPVANLSATFGATIGQNGCAGIYPAMLATMVAPTIGINPLDPAFIAGLSGGQFEDQPVHRGDTHGLARLEPIGAAGLPALSMHEDMARTALNVNGAMTAGVLTGRLLKDLPADAADAAPVGGEGR